MDFRQLVEKRRMVRRFDQRPVPRERLMKILDVVRYTPSAGFSQGFEFIVLDEPSQVERFWEVTQHPDHPVDEDLIAYRPPCIVLPVANVNAYLERYSRPDKMPFGRQHAEEWPMPFWYIDTGMAVMLALLSAVEEDLGAWFFGLQWIPGEQTLSQELGIPEGCRPIGALGLGYALPETIHRGPYSNRRRPLETMIHFGAWDATKAAGAADV